jgi:hypothetical protein
MIEMAFAAEDLLRAAGLVAGHRQARSVLYARTAPGQALVGAPPDAAG